MAATKSALTTGWSSTAVAVSTTTNGTAMDLTTAYGAVITVQVVTTTAPTSVGTVTVSVAPTTGGTFVTWAVSSIQMAASQTQYFGWEIPPAIGAVRVDITTGTGTGVTVSAQCEALTGI